LNLSKGEARALGMFNIIIAITQNGDSINAIVRDR
jgi:hypothetical protein